jgi:hypothetical protein
MELARYVDEVRQQLIVAAEAGDDEVRAVAERLVSAAAPAMHLALLDALGDAAAEITAELAPGSVELRLRGRQPGFAVTLPPVGPEGGGAPPPPSTPPPRPTEDTSTADLEGDAELARINLRLPKALKDRIERAAARDGLSINAWLVRAVSAAADPAPTPTPAPRPAASGGDRFTGWAQ